jgi:hypothetical protein
MMLHTCQRRRYAPKLKTQYPSRVTIHQPRCSVRARLLPGRRRARISRALSKHRIRGARHRNTSALAVLFPASRMVYLAANLDRVHPHKIVRILRPLRLEVLLADGARRVGEHDVLRNKHISVFRLLLDSTRSPRRTIGQVFRSCLVDLAILNPLLQVCQKRFISSVYVAILTFSVKYQLRWTPRLAASGSFILKCQSM